MEEQDPIFLSPHMTQYFSLHTCSQCSAPPLLPTDISSSSPGSSMPVPAPEIRPDGYHIGWLDLDWSGEAQPGVAKSPLASFPSNPHTARTPWWPTVCIFSAVNADQESGYLCCSVFPLLLNLQPCRELCRVLDWCQGVAKRLLFSMPTLNLLSLVHHAPIWGGPQARWKQEPGWETAGVWEQRSNSFDIWERYICFPRHNCTGCAGELGGHRNGDHLPVREGQDKVLPLLTIVMYKLVPYIRTHTTSYLPMLYYEGFLSWTV